MSSPSTTSHPFRGEVYWLDFDPSVGSEMQGVHPALVVQNDTGNRHSALTIVVAITGNLRLARLPVCVLVPAGEGGLTKDSIVNCGHLYTVDQTRLRTKLGELGPQWMALIDEALKKSLAL